MSATTTTRILLSVQEEQSCSLDESLESPLLPLHHSNSENTAALFTCSLNPLLEEEEQFLNAAELYSLPSLYPGSRSNIRKILAATWFGCAGRTIWIQTLLPILVHVLYPEEPGRVGYVTAAMGGTQVLAGLFTQHCIAPVWKRNELLQWASLIGLLALAILFDAVLFEIEWWWLLGGLCTWSFMWGITDTVMPALFADSLPEHSESLYYTRASRVIRSSNTVGPVLVFLLFLFVLEDEWTMKNCALIVALGLGLCTPMVVLLCCLQEIDEEQELLFDDMPRTDSNANSKENAVNSVNITEETVVLTAVLEDSQTSSGIESLVVCGGYKQSTIVPLLVTVSSILSGIASGISIRYFPVFMIKEMELLPTRALPLCIMTPLGQALTKFIAKHSAKYTGASIVSAVLQSIFVCLLLLMLYCHTQGMPVWIVSVFYVGQAFLMNSSTSLTQSILLATVPEQQAKKWVLAEMVQLLVWSAGAGFGGYLVRTQGVLAPFYATAAIQAVSTLLAVILCFVGPKWLQINPILFPSDSSQLFDHVATTDFDNSDYETSGQPYENFQDSREIICDNSSSSSQTEDFFFDCESGASREATATYDIDTRCCVNNDDRPAHVPAGSSTHVVPDNVLMSCHGNEQRAASSWKYTQKWRQEGSVWNIHTLPNPWYVQIREAYPHYIHGFSKGGYPVVYERPGKMKLKVLLRSGCSISDMTRWYTFFMEYLSNCVEPPEGLREGPWGFVVVMDMQGAGISLLSSDVLSYLKQAGEINSAHYPLSMKRSLLINAGSLVANVWKGVRKVLPESVHTEVYKSPSSLTEFIDIDQIPREYGGISPYQLGRHPHEVALQQLVQALSSRSPQT